MSYTSLRWFIRRRNWGWGGILTVRMADTERGALAEADFGRLGMIGGTGDGTPPRSMGADSGFVLFAALPRPAHQQPAPGGRRRQPEGSLVILR